MIQRFKKRIFLSLIFVLFIIIASAWIKPSNSFKNDLKGEMVNSYRTDGKVLDIYSISASGENKRLLFHNNHPTNSNSIFPTWSDGGSKIRFVAMKNGWNQWVMDANGANPTVLDEKPLTTTMDSRKNDIVVDMGSIFYLDSESKKHLIYEHKNFDPKTNPGPYEVRWGPGKEYITASLDGNVVVIRKKDGELVKITEGYDADWKW